MTIKIVNVSKLKKNQRHTVCYVGRTFAGWAGHKLGNPYKKIKLENGEVLLDDCLNKYREWLLRRPTLEIDLKELWKQCGHGTLPLGCWCTDSSSDQAVVCHAQILGKMLDERFENQEVSETGDTSR